MRRVGRVALRIAIPLLFSDSGINWVLRILGKTVDTAPLTDPYLGNGRGEVGSLTVVEVDGTFAADGTKIDFTAQSTPVWGDQYLRDADGQTRVRGLMAAGRIIIDGVTKQLVCGLWNDTVADNLGLQGVYTSFSGLRVIAASGGSIDLGLGLTNGDQIDWMVIARATGSYIFASINDSNWRLIWWFDADSTITLYTGFSNFDAAGEVRLIEATILPESLVPSPIVSDDYSLIPVVKDEGDNNLDAVYNRVGLDGSEAHFSPDSDGHVDLFSAAFNTFFGRNEGGMIVRPKMANIDVWTDGRWNVFAHFGVDLNNNRVFIAKTNSDTGLTWYRIAGGTTKIITKNTTTIDRMTLAMIWSDTHDEINAYFDGTLEGQETGIGTFVGALVPNKAVWGAQGNDAAFDQTLNGSLSDCILFNSFNSNYANIGTTMSAIHTKLDAGTLTNADLDGYFGTSNWAWYRLGERYTTDGLAHLEADGNGAGKVRDGRTWSSEGNQRYNGAVGGEDVILTGDFASDTNWDKGTGWAIASGVATKSAGSGSDLSQTVAPLTSGIFYRTAHTITNRTAGTTTLKYGTALGVARSTNATHIEVVRANGTAAAVSADSSYDGDEDNVSYLPMAIADLLDLTDSGQAEHFFATNLTITDNTQGGGCVAADSGKQDFIIAYYDRIDNKVKADKYIAGVLDTAGVISVSKTYSATAQIRIGFSDIDADGTYNLTVWYNDVFVATVTVSDAAIVGNTYVGEFGLLEDGFAETEEVYRGNESNKYDKFLVGAL